MKPIDKLISLLKQDKVIPVVGAGVAYAAARLPGWKGFIENGLEYADNRKLDVTGADIKAAKEFLKKGELTKGANIMKKLLNAPAHPFADWLDDFLSNPKIESEDLLNSINNLCTPIILTTNYDNLLYSTTKIKTKKIFDWSQHEDTARALNKQQEFLLHLHGVYDRPRTIILSGEDYKTLNKKLGYKSVLKDLWTSYHFLFIGCSKDGVMDDDFSTIFKFLNKWFPSVPNEHFILLHQTDISKGIQVELAKIGNVAAITYGTDYGALPFFINDFNPNWEKAHNKTKEIHYEIKKQFDSQLLLSSGKITNSSSKMFSFLKDTLPNGIHWIDSLQVSFLEQIWDAYNQKIKSKSEKFTNYQILIKGLINLSDLNNRISFWQNNHDNPSALNTNAFIDLAILAYECLNKFPKDTLEDIRHRAYYAIHDYYFDGHLGGFIRQYVELKKSGIIDVEDFFSDDKYFFENLKRILTSLQGVLDLNPDELYKEIPPALITHEITTAYLIFVSSNEITLRHNSISLKIFAKLPAEPTLPFKDAHFVNYRGNTIIIGHTSQSCFYWNPQQDISANHFFNAPLNTAITQSFSKREDEGINTHIFCGMEIIIFTNFKKVQAYNLKPRLNEYIYFSEQKYWIGKKDVNDRQYGPFLFLFKQEATQVIPLLKVEDIWGVIRNFPAVAKRLKKEIDEEQLDNEASHWLFPFLSSVNVQPAFYAGKQIFLLRTQVRLTRSFFTVIFGFALQEESLSTLFSICLPHKSCLAFDLVTNGQDVHLVCGYLARGLYPKKLVQIFKINFNSKVVASDENSIIDSNGNATNDVSCVCALPGNKAFAVQQEKVYHIDFNDLTYQEYKAERVIKIISVF